MFNGAEVILKDGDALLLVDIQNDFLPNGKLGIPLSDRILPVVSKWIRKFWAEGLPIVATRDWHPDNHCSFQEFGGDWVPHCIAETNGAKLHQSIRYLETTLKIHIERFDKGTEYDKDSYSGFNVQSVDPYGEDAMSDLDEWLMEKGVERLIVVGLATDYCVLHTVKDALLFGNMGDGYKVIVDAQGIDGVGINLEDIPNALGEMIYCGGAVIQ